LPLAAVAAVLAAQGIDPKEMRMSASAYHPKPAVSIRTEARLVDVGVVVRDSRGHAVSGLTRADFRIEDNGKPRKVTAFSVRHFIPAAASAPTASFPALSVPASASAPPPAPAPAPEKPRYVALVFDDLSMPFDDLTHARSAAKRFLKSGMAAGDRVAVMTISSGLVLGFTAGEAAIEQAIDKVVLRQRKIEPRVCPRMQPYEAYLIVNHLDSAALDAKVDELVACGDLARPRGNLEGGQVAVDMVKTIASGLWEQTLHQSRDIILTVRNFVDAMAKLDGSRVILLTSSGFLSGNLESDLDEVAERALRSGVVINSLDAKGLYVVDQPDAGRAASLRSMIFEASLLSRPKEAANEAMFNLAESTGGLFFHNQNDLELGFRELGMQPETSYLLGYVPDPPDGKYHRLKVTLVSQRHETVQARMGYMAVAAPPPAMPEPEPERRIDREARGTAPLDEAPVKLAARPDKLGNGNPAANLSFQWDVTRIAFKMRDGALVQRLDMVAALLDGKGDFVAGREGVAELALSQASFTRLATGGFNMVLRVDAPPGSYQLRVVAADDGEEHVSAITLPVELK
jgi:VWFA-related protein